MARRALTGRSLTRSSTSLTLPFSSYTVAILNTGQWVAGGAVLCCVGLICHRKLLTWSESKAWFDNARRVGEASAFIFYSKNPNATPPRDVGPLKRFLCHSTDANSWPNEDHGLHARVILSDCDLSVHAAQLHYADRRADGQSIRDSGIFRFTHPKLWGAICQ